MPAVPLVTRDGTRITSENKENQDTWEYFINNVYNKTSQYNDILGTPVYTLYLTWLEETYGQNKLERLWAWLDQAISQIVLGNYEENSTVTGTVGQVLMGLANLDLPGDIRDLSYDLIHWDTTKEHILQTVLDAAGLLPVIGAVKYGDEASSALKHADEVGEQTAKHGDSILTNTEKDVTSQIKITDNDYKYFGKMGKYIENPGIKIDWSKYANHGYKRLAERGMTKELVDDIVQSGKVLEQANGEKYVYITTKGVVVVSQDGKLITGWSKDYFDEEMKEIIKILLKEEI